MPGSNQTFLLKLFASVDGSGTPLSARTLVENIVLGQTNDISTTLDGVVSTVAISMPNGAIAFGHAGTANVVVNGLDASGKTIVGPGVFADENGNPVTVTIADADPSGATKLAQTAVTQSSAIALSYTGAAIATIPLTATFGTHAPVTSMVAVPCATATTAERDAYFVYGGFNPSFSEGFGRFSASDAGSGIAPDGSVSFYYGGSLAISVDSRADAYVEQFDSDLLPYVAQYCPDATGSTVPYRSYEVTASAYRTPTGSLIYATAVDRANRLFALIPQSILTFATDGGTPGFPNTATIQPISTISGSNTTLANARELALDPTGGIYVGEGSSIVNFPSGSHGNVAPAATLTDTTGGLLFINGMRTDHAGNVFAVYSYNALDPKNAYGSSALVEYAHGSYARPERIVSGPLTTLGNEVAFAIDQSENVYVLADFPVSSNQGPFSTVTNVYSVEEFTAAQNGNVAPAKTFAVTGAQDTDIAVDGTGDVAIGDFSGYGILLYTGGAYAGQIGVSPTVGEIGSVAYDAAGNLYVESERYTDSSDVSHGKLALETFMAPVKPSSTPATLDPIAFPHAFYNQLAIDGKGTIYASSPNRGIDVYAPGDTSGTPARSILDSVANEYYTGVGLDGTGAIYTGLGNHDVVDVLPADANGTAVATASYEDILGSTLDLSSLAVDQAGDTFVASCVTNSVAEFAPGAALPERQILGPATHLDCPQSIALDSSDHIVVATASGVSVFDATDTGDVAPLRAFTATSTSGLGDLAIGPGAALGTGSGAMSRTRADTLSTVATRPLCREPYRRYDAADARYPHALPPRRGFELPTACADLTTLKGRLAARRG